MTVSLAKCREKLLGNVKNSHLGRALERTNHFQVYFQCPGVHLLGDRTLVSMVPEDRLLTFPIQQFSPPQGPTANPLPVRS